MFFKLEKQVSALWLTVPDEQYLNFFLALIYLPACGEPHHRALCIQNEI